MKNRHIILIAILAVVPWGLQAQNGLNIPFSQFGIGLSELPLGTPMAYSMGGAVYSRASRNTVNPFNPASYAAVEKESFVFDIGVNVQSCVLLNDKEHQTDADGNLAYITVAFPLTKWWKTSVGLLPYSSVNYESAQSVFDSLTNSQVKTLYEGTGGVSQLYWGHAFNLGPRLSVGFNLNYLYGPVNRGITYLFDKNDSTYCQNSRRQKTTYVSNLLFDLGVQYWQPLGEKYTLHLGATCRTPRNMTVEDHALAYTYYSDYLFDTIFPLPGGDGIFQSTLQQPLAVGVGLALERNERWEVDVDGYYSAFGGIRYNENAEIPLFGQSAARYDVPNWRLSLGGEWKGDAGASSYVRRIGFSAGAYYSSGRQQLQLTGQQEYRLDEWGCGMGAKLPMRKGQSVLMLSVGYTHFGRTDLLSRDVLSLGISVGSCERWFVKRKYN